ncbi:gp53-like domain-containing protein [Citrobacter farmeri]|uniref:gp53-like domain-containing protein n=1 Tax=Citrobacter farmeri TaxID=67824 RepID=UPI00374CB6B4
MGDIATAGVGTGVLSGAGRITLPLIIGGVKQNLIIQWGNITTTAGSGPITFPLAFPTALLASYACEYNSSIWKPGSDAACAVYGIDTKSRTGMRIASLTYSGGTWVNANAQCQWFALGY